MVEVDQWENILPDMLDEIARRMYFYDDYVRLRHVCKQWNLSLPHAPSHRNPWLVLPFDEQVTLNIDGLSETEIYHLNPWLVLPFDETFNNSTHGLEEKEIYHLRLPNMKDDFFRGSSHGYLITVMASGELRMLDPFTKSQFDLPPISTFPNIVAYDPDEDEYTLIDLKTDMIGTLKRPYVHKTQLEKIITSSPPNHKDFMAVAIYSEHDRLAYCRLGYSRWIDIPNETIECRFQDVIFHGGKIYVVDGGSGLHEFDVKNGTPLRGFENIQVGLPLDYVPYSNHKHRYLISSPNGALLMVIRNVIRFFDSDILSKCCFWTFKFNIHILNNDHETKQPTWSRLNSMGKYAMILGFNSSTWMLPDTTSNLHGNQIYYTDNLLGNHFGHHFGDLDIPPGIGGHDIGIFDLDDGINNRMFPNSSLLYPPPVWLLPIDVP